MMPMSKLGRLAGPRCLALSAVSAHAALDAGIEFDPVLLEKETSLPSLALDDELSTDILKAARIISY